MKNFENMTRNELVEIEGGSILATVASVVGIAGTVYLIYQGVREQAKDAGRADAYRDLGYTK